jgi:hypothetical protein
LFGLIGTFGALSAAFLEEGSRLIRVVFVLAHLGMLALSVAFQQRSYLVFGILGLYVYFTWLVFDRYADEPFFPLLLAALGISVVVVTVLCQKYARVFWRQIRRGAAP